MVAVGEGRGHDGRLGHLGRHVVRRRPRHAGGVHVRHATGIEVALRSSSLPLSMANPDDMEWLLLIPPSTLVGGVFQPVSILYKAGTGCWAGYTLPLSSDIGDIPVRSADAEPWWWWAWASELGLPARLEGEYRHSIPQARQREQIGLAFEHLTFARKQPSQDARRRGWRGFDEDAMLGAVKVERN